MFLSLAQNKFIKKNVWFLLALFGLVFIGYVNTFDNSFLSDDIASILQAPEIKDFSFVMSRLTGFTRPTFYFLISNIFGNENPVPFHLLNFMFHLGNVLLIFVLLTKLFNKTVGLIASALFAVHPVLTEAVTWISGGAYSEATFFLLLSFLMYTLQKKGYYVTSLISFYLALNTQYIPFVFPAILFLYEFLFGSVKKSWLRLLPYFLLAGLFVLISIASIPNRVNDLVTIHYQEQGVNNPEIVLPVALTSYLGLIFWPQGLTLYHSELSFDIVSFWSRILVSALFLAALIFTFFKDKKIFFWLSFFVLTLSPTIVPSILRLTWIIAERYLYTASLGIFVVIGILLDELLSLPKLKKNILIFYVVGLTVLLGLLATTIVRNDEWQNQDTLWIAAAKTSPSSPNNHNNLGDMYGRHGDRQSAIREFQTAIALKPNYADAYHNLANTYHEIGDDEKAMEYYQKAATINPYLWQSHQNMAAIYFQRKQYDRALEQVQEGLKVNPRNNGLKNNLGVIYLIEGNKEKAKAIFMEVLNSDPQNLVANQGLTATSK